MSHRLKSVYRGHSSRCNQESKTSIAVSVPTGDVALLKLNASAHMDEFTGTIDIDKTLTAIVEGASCTAYGWGQAAEG